MIELALSRILRALGRLFAYPILMLLYLLWPIVRIKIGRLRASRIGHLSSNTETFLRRRALQIHDSECIYILMCDPRRVSNRQLLKMYKRGLVIIDKASVYDFYTGLEHIVQKTKFYQPIESISREYREFVDTTSSLSFLDSELIEGHKFLRNYGLLDKNAWFVCVYARDSTYLSMSVLHKGHTNKWSYHDYRDGDIDTYVEAIEYIIQLGGFVFRMGNMVGKDVDYRHEKFFDYGISDSRSDFLDIFLSANCRFFIGDTGGLGFVPIAFDVPFVGVNWTPFGLPPLGGNSIFVPKRIRSRETHEYVSFVECIEKGLDAEHDGNSVSKIGYEYENSTPRQIVAATKEIIERLNCKQPRLDEADSLLHRYRCEFLPMISGSNIESLPSRDFIVNNKDLYFPPEDLSHSVKETRIAEQ